MCRAKQEIQIWDFNLNFNLKMYGLIIFHKVTEICPSQSFKIWNSGRKTKAIWKVLAEARRAVTWWNDISGMRVVSVYNKWAYVSSEL